jgi:starch-binding outer membrane protein, SusD/RagB family
MKNLAIKYAIIAVAVSLTIGSCSKDFLEAPTTGSYELETYYATKEQAYAGLVAAYSALRKNSGGFENYITMLNAGSDDHNPGGADPFDGIGIHAFGHFTVNGNNMPDSFWKTPYEGIYNSNILIDKIKKTEMDGAEKSRFIAECKALRGFYYFNLVSMFRNVPLILKPIGISDISTVTQAAPEAVYAQIEKDLKEAIAVLPVEITANDKGRFSKGAATALLGKVFLYEKKYPEAAEQLALVNGTPGGTSAYGYKLLDKYSDLWKVENKFNSESILEVLHSEQSLAGWDIWGSPKAQGNVVNVMVAPRGYSKEDGSNADDIPSGWSFNPIREEVYNLLKQDPNDTRFAATVLDMNALLAAKKVKQFTLGDENTGYFLNKFIPRQKDVRTGAGEGPLNYKQDTYAIRLADTYLMEAEALRGTGSRAQALLDAVRKRAGLNTFPAVTIDNILKERRLELVGEGFRWLDLVRTDKASAALQFKGFVAGKNEVFPIPILELNNTKLVQNPQY